MATFRGSNHQVGASSVWTNGDLANLIDNLYRQSIRAGARGDYERGLRDMAQSIADATNTEIDLYPDGRYDRYNANVHAERITERYERIEERYERHTPPPAVPERRFAIRGEREEWPAVEPYQTQPTLATTDAEYHDFVPGKGTVRRMEGGWMWLGNDGTKQFYPVQQWVELCAADARRLGYLFADNRTFVLAMRSSVEARQRQIGQSVRVLPPGRKLLP